MVEFGVQDRDVHRSRQPQTSNDLLLACNTLKTSIKSVDASLTDAAQSAGRDFQGYFAEVFRSNCQIRAQDADNLIN